MFALPCSIALLGAERGRAEDPGETASRLFATSDRCLACHNGLVAPSGLDVSIGSSWRSSMMANSARDPYWQAAVRRETLDHPEAKEAIEDECAACHMPMARYGAKVSGLKGDVFSHLPIAPAHEDADRLAADGVSCSMCHQIRDEKLGTEESFTAGFVVDAETPLGERAAFGPYAIDAGRTRVMRSASRFVPSEGLHVQESALCGTCHTLYTHTRGPGGETIGELPEQMPYLEWLHSGYRDERSCQSCHLPRLEETTRISSVLGQPRDGLSRHVFRGGNFLMPRILSRNRHALGVAALSGELAETARETADHLRTKAGGVSIERAEIANRRFEISVSVENLTGHKLPTAYPSRRAWIHLTVRDSEGGVVFDSGGLRSDGSIAGNDNDLDPSLYEPHHAEIDDEDRVQIYEAIMVDPDDRVTTGLLSAIRFVKDNRILPLGFDKATAGEDIAVRGRARTDEDFTDDGDRVLYRVDADPERGPFTVEAELWYQPIAFRWARNVLQQRAPETERFASYYDALSDRSAIVIARDTRTVE